MSVVAKKVESVARIVRLTEAVELNPRPERGAVPDDLEVSFVPMAAVGATTGRMDASSVRPFGEVKKGYTFFREGDVLFAKITPCMENGKMVVARGLRNGVGCGSTEFHVLRPRPGVDPHYVYHFVSSARFRAEAAHHMTGAVGQKRVPAPFLEQSRIALPELDEQRRVVAEIEKQFSRLDEAVANLKRVKANLKRYKVAVLKAAVEGRLVPTEAELARREGRSYETGAQLLQRILETRRSQWKGKGKYKEPAEPDANDLPVLPQGWAWASPEQISAGESYSLAIGPFGSNLKVSDYVTEGVLLVFVRNIRAISFGGRDAVFVTADKAEELRAHWVEAGDLLITKMGDPPGDVCIYPVDMPRAVITADCIKLKLSSIFSDARFFAYAIESETVRRQIQGITKGVAQLKVSLGRFSTIALPLPPLNEQHRIVAEVDRRISLVRELDSMVDANHMRSEALRRTLLTQSFSISGLAERT